MDWLEFSQYPCPLCGSIEYRDFGGGFHCREGHRNAELLELVGDDDDDFLRSKMSMRGTQLSASKLTSSTSKVAQRKRKLRSGRGDHDINARYGVSAEEQEALFEEERDRFKRSGDLSAYVDLEAMMQIILNQLSVLKNDPQLGWSEDGQFSRCEGLARRLFGAYCGGLVIRYDHIDRDHPELNFKGGRVEFGDELDRELFLSDHDYSAEESLSESLRDSSDSLKGDSLRDLRSESTSPSSSIASTSTNASPTQSTQSPKSLESHMFKYSKKARPFANPLSPHNATLITYLSLLFSGLPILPDDLSLRMELSFLPGYHPDFILSKDLVTTRVTSRGLRRFYTRHLPSAAELYSNTELMLRCLSRQCNAPEWTVPVEPLLRRVMTELCIPQGLEPVFARFIVPTCQPLKFRMINGVFAGPAAQVAAGVVFVCRLMLWGEESLLQAWRERVQQLRQRINDPEHCTQPLTDPEAFDQLLRAANVHCYNRLLPESLAATQNIFGPSLVGEIFSLAQRPVIGEFKAGENLPVARITALKPHFEEYRKYPVDVHLGSVEERYQLVLEIVEGRVGVRGGELHKIICSVYE